MTHLQYQIHKTITNRDIMKAIDNSNLCGECTGSGWACNEPCKICRGTGVEPEKKQGKIAWWVKDGQREYLFPSMDEAIGFQSFWKASIVKAITI